MYSWITGQCFIEVTYQVTGYPYHLHKQLPLEVMCLRTYCSRAGDYEEGSRTSSSRQEEDPPKVVGVEQVTKLLYLARVLSDEELS